MDNSYPVGQVVELNHAGAVATKLPEGTTVTVKFVAEGAGGYLYGVVTHDRKEFTLYDDEIL